MKRVLGCIRRADERYRMIHPGDKICVGVSGGKDSLLLLYGVLLLLVAVSWKSFQLRSSQRQLQRGMRECTYEFDDDEIICNTEAGVTRYSYEQTYAVVSDKDWYAIFFDISHGIVIRKTGFTVGDPVSFKAFIGQHTQLPIQEI